MPKIIKGITGTFQVDWSKSGKAILTRLTTTPPTRRTPVGQDDQDNTSIPKIIQGYDGAWTVNRGN